MVRFCSCQLCFHRADDALSVRELPVGKWIYEMKINGYRALAFKVDQEVRLVSRNRNSFNDDYPALIGSLKSPKPSFFHYRRRGCCARRTRKALVPASSILRKGQTNPLVLSRSSHPKPDPSFRGSCYRPPPFGTAGPQVACIVDTLYPRRYRRLPFACRRSCKVPCH